MEMQLDHLRATPRRLIDAWLQRRGVAPTVGIVRRRTPAPPVTLQAVLEVVRCGLERSRRGGTRLRALP